MYFEVLNVYGTPFSISRFVMYAVPTTVCTIYECKFEGPALRGGHVLSRKIKNMIRRATSFFDGLASLGFNLPNRELDHILFDSTIANNPENFTSPPTFFFRHRPVGVFGDRHFERTFQANIFKTSTVSFKELHPLLLVSIPFQTNKINIRLSVKTLFRTNFTS